MIRSHKSQKYHKHPDTGLVSGIKTPIGFDTETYPRKNKASSLIIQTTEYMTMKTLTPIKAIRTK